MLNIISRLLGNLFVGVCISSFTTVAIVLLLTLRNLPGILSGLQRLLRSMLRGSFHLYKLILKPLRVWIWEFTGLDIFMDVPRTIATIILSTLIGTSFIVILSWQIRWWVILLLILHGAFVGIAWDSILRSDEFQLGVSLE